MKSIVSSVRWVLRGGSGTAATLQTMLAKLLILATNVATGSITARILGDTGRGEQAAMTLWPQFLAFALTLGLPAALRYNLKRYPEEESELFSASLLLSAVLGIVAMLIGIVFIPQWLNQYSQEVIRFAQLLMVLAPLALLSTNLTATLEADGNFTTANQMGYLSPIATLFILAGLALTQSLTPFTAALAYALPGLPVFFWVFTHLWKRYHPRLRKLSTSYKRLINYGLRAYGIDLLGTLAGQVDQAFVVNFLPPAAVGKYVVALSISRMLNLFADSIIKVLLPKTAARPMEEVISLTGRAARVSIFVTVLAAMFVMLVSPMLLPLYAGADFLGAVPVFRILAVDVTISSTNWILAQPFMALGRPTTVTIIEAFGLGVTVPLMIVFIPAFGLEGAGLALLSATILRFVSVLLSYPIILKVRPPSLIINKEDLTFVIKTLELKQD